IQYTNVNTLATQAMIGKRVPQVFKENISKFETFIAEVKNISLLKKPLKGGNPAIEKLPIIATVKETGINDIKPPNLRIYLVPIFTSIVPLPLMNAPVNVEWLTR